MDYNTLSQQQAGLQDSISQAQVGMEKALEHAKALGYDDLTKDLDGTIKKFSRLTWNHRDRINQMSLF